MINLKHTMGAAAMALLLTLGLTACDDGTDAEFGTVSVLLTDAAGEQVDEAWVTITDIYLQSESGEGDPEEGRHYLLEDATETHQLRDLANKATDLVSEDTVPTGTYGQLRVVISGGCVVTDAGDVYASSSSYVECGPEIDGELNMPSYGQSGVKVLLNGLQVTGGQQVLMLDFNVEDSFGRAAGNSGMWVMDPVIHGGHIDFTTGVDVTLSAGEVTLPEGFELGQFSATLVPTTGDNSTVDFTDPDEDGIFEASFQFLFPDDGPWDVELNSPEGLTVTVDPTSPVTVSPANGETAEVNWTLQTAEAETSG